jgi:hypothetical protein
MNKVKTYEGQALAIVMIVLIVAAVIGIAMMSRTISDQQRVVEEKISAEALEVSDSLLDVVRGVSLEEINNACTTLGAGAIDSENGCEVENMDDFLSQANISDSVLDGFDSCTTDDSLITMDVSLATMEDELEVRDNSVRSFVLAGQSPTDPACTLNMTFEGRGTDNAGVLVSKIYAKDHVDGIPGEYKSYDYDDMQGYCLGVGCPDGVQMSGSWIEQAEDAILSIPLDDVDANGFMLDEVRVRPVNGVVAMKSEVVPNGCVLDSQMVKVVVGATCSGSYRAKSIQIPQQEWALPLFDYVLFNGGSVLQPE